jgi:hypothetical protein
MIGTAMPGMAPAGMPTLPSRESFFAGLHSAIDNIEQSTRPLTTAPATAAAPMHGPGCSCGCGGHHEHHGHRHQHGYGCGCDECGHGGGCGCEECGCGDSPCGCREDACACRCCIGDADLVVRTRVGERRVVPLTIVNERRRERDVQLALGEFQTRGGNAAPVKGEITPTTFTLAACSEQQAVLVVEVVANQLGTKAAVDQPRTLPDVDDCTVAYADLTVTGCDRRPLRIAVAVLPRDCDTHRVGCGCGCC